MVLLIALLVIAGLMLIWFWKVPVAGMVSSLKRDGSSVFEAYMIVFIMLMGSVAVIYTIWKVI
ncbi:MAG TPA: hypothetical protein VK112_06130 [Fodinibius sp.]|nr:hypothetical protein [Fodinibius sp.]